VQPEAEVIVVNARRRWVLWFAVEIVVLLLAWPAWAGSQPEITQILMCRERPTEFEARGWTSSFTSEDDSVYCLAKVNIPSSASKRSYDATLKWYAPDSELYYTHEYDDLKRGYTWSLWGSISVRGARAADLTGTWRVVFSVKFGPSKSHTFTIKSSTSSTRTPSPLLDWPLISQPAQEKPVIGREEEPNETSQTANLLGLDEGVQGETRFYSNTVYDQDWFRINLESNRKYWLVINAVGTTSQWLSPASFLRLYKSDRLNDPLSFSSYSRQEHSEERSTCDLVVPLQGPATYYISISAQECEHDVIYSLQVATTEPEWVEE
jgi:hypothetical protein